MLDLRRITGFDWDDGNARKNAKHGVSMAEAEQVFFNAPLLLLADETHSLQEPAFTHWARRTRGEPCTSPSRCASQVNAFA